MVHLGALWELIAVADIVGGIQLTKHLLNHALPIAGQFSVDKRSPETCFTFCVQWHFIWLFWPGWCSFDHTNWCFTIWYFWGSYLALAPSPTLLRWWIKGHGYGICWPQYSISFLIGFPNSVSLHTTYSIHVDHGVHTIFPGTIAAAHNNLQLPPPLLSLSSGYLTWTNGYVMPPPIIFFSVTHNWNDAPGPMSNIHWHYTIFVRMDSQQLYAIWWWVIDNWV